jgi:uncharacterized C2H2 Zn-finger protein
VFKEADRDGGELGKPPRFRKGGVYRAGKSRNSKVVKGEIHNEGRKLVKPKVTTEGSYFSDD